MTETTGTTGTAPGALGETAGGAGADAATGRAGRRALGPIRTSESGKVIGSKFGVVDTDVRDKTRKVVVSYKAPHAKYGKYVSRKTVLHVHDEQNESHRGDVVEVAPCRPISKTKSWRLVRVVERRSAV